MPSMRIFDYQISIHSPRMGRDLSSCPRRLTATVFQSTLPAWGETFFAVKYNDCRRISIHSPRMGRDGTPTTPPSYGMISIHSPRMGRDLYHGTERGPAPYFNPLSPHGERPTAAQEEAGIQYFNPLSPHGERPSPPRARGPPAPFQSTLPAWGETPLDFAWTICYKISIHSPRMGRDIIAGHTRYKAAQFQSTLPAWGETPAPISTPTRGRNFNPLSPHGERRPAMAASTSPTYFNPLSPHGERLRQNLYNHLRGHISIHSPRMGRDDESL